MPGEEPIEKMSNNEPEEVANEVPKTAENLRALCTEDKGLGEKAGIPLHYKGSKFRLYLDGGGGTPLPPPEPPRCPGFKGGGTP